MSKVLYVCARNAQSLQGMEHKFPIIAKRISPDNISVSPPAYVQNQGIAYSIINRVSSVQENGSSVLLGMTYPNDDQWFKPLESYPDGSYAIFRADDRNIEILTDAAASRTIWYYQNQEIFIASSSQRAIVMLLGDHDFNHQTISWVLSSGNPGPFNSWDKRIKTVPADSSVILDRQSWSISIKSNPVEFSPKDIPDEEHTELFQAAIAETFQDLKLDYSKWILPLSGGYDSRLILCMLNLYNKSKGALQSITWGLKSAAMVKGNDAFVAKQLADHFHISNTYYNTDISNEPLKEVFQRFLVNGEGRIDHISAYLDGFSLWKQLFENKVEGLIRGDVAFTSKTAASSFFVRQSQGFPLCTDFENLKDYESYGIAKQEVPGRFHQLQSESLEQFRDRIYEEFRVPTVLAALTDLKLAYVEIINPLLSRKIIYQGRRLPAHLRNEKLILKNLVNAIGPDIKMASDGATGGVINVLRSAEAVDLFRKEFSDPSQTVIPPDFCTYILENLKTEAHKQPDKTTVKALLKRYLPSSLKKKMMPFKSHSNLDFNLIAFRMFTIIKMNKLLKEDAEALLPIPIQDNYREVSREDDYYA